MKKKMKPDLKKTSKGWVVFNKDKRVSHFYNNKNDAKLYMSYLLSR